MKGDNQMKFHVGDRVHIGGEIEITGANKCKDKSLIYHTNIGTVFTQYAADNLAYVDEA